MISRSDIEKKSFNSVSLDDLIKKNGEVEAIEVIMQEKLYRSFSDRGVVEFLGVLESLGRYFDVLSIFEENNRLIRNAELVSIYGNASYGLGNPEKVLGNNFEELFLADANMFFKSIGSSYIKCMLQWINRSLDVDSDFNKRVILYIENHYLFRESINLENIVILLFCRFFGERECRVQLNNVAKLLQIAPPTYAVATFMRFSQDGSQSHKLSQLSKFPREELFPEAPVLLRTGIGKFRELSCPLTDEEAFSRNFCKPEVCSEQIKEAIKRLSLLVGEIYYNQLGAPYHTAAEKIGVSLRAPVLVLSTGRVGTDSLCQLLKKSNVHEPFHNLSFHLENGDLNELLFRMMAGDIDAPYANEILQKFLEYRMQEIFWASSQGKTPVFVNHFDMVLAPVFMGVFPSTQFIHLLRDPAKTFISLTYKRQFQYAQLRPIWGRHNKENGLFEFSRPAKMNTEQHVVWYMKTSSVFANALQEVATPNAKIELNMERTFSLERDALAELLDVFPNSGLSVDDLEKHFSKKINAKEHFVVPPPYDNLDRARQILVDEGAQDLLRR